MFSVIIPVHNKLPHLDRSVFSVLDQSFTDFELLLIDDASTDGSSEKIKSYDDPRIRVFYRDTPGPGGYAARNLGIKEAKYDWICFLDADDKWDTEFLNAFKKAINDNKNTPLFSAKWVRVTEENSFQMAKKSTQEANLYKTFDLSDYLTNYRYMWTSAVVAHKDLIKKQGGFPSNTPCKSGGDVETWIRWLNATPKSILINQLLAFYYQDAVNQVTAKPPTYFCAYETVRAIQKNENNSISLRQLAKRYIDRSLYNMLVKQIQNGMPIAYPEIKKMSFSWYSFLRISKLHLIRFKMLF